MSAGILSLAQEYRGAKLGAGDLVTIQAFTNEKVGAVGDAWKLECPAGTQWLEAGSLTVSCAESAALAADGQNSKIALRALVHQPLPPFTIGALTLRHVPSGTTLTFDPTELGAEASAPATKEEMQAAPWILPAVAFGGWNWWLIGVLAALLLAAAAFGLRKFLRRLPGRLKKKLTHQEVALRAFQELQKFARSKKVLEQEQWKKFSFELAGALRKYIDVNFAIDSSDQTDRELLEELRRLPKAKSFVEILATILSTIDEVRYGKKALDATVVPGLLLEARKFVDNTYQAREEA